MKDVKSNLIKLILFLSVLMILSCPDPGSEETEPPDTNLMGLDISGCTMSEFFSSEITGYTASADNIDIETVRVTAVKNSSWAMIELRFNGGAWEEIMSGYPSSDLELVPGNNTVEVKVTDQDQVTVKIYTVGIYRPSASISLASLTTAAGALSPAFSSGTLEYSLALDSVTDSISFTAAAEDPESSLEARINSEEYASILSGTVAGPYTVDEGYNSLEIKVTAEDGLSAGIYTIDIYRTSGNSSLSGITLSEGDLSPVLASDTTAYSSSIASGTDLFRLTPTAESSEAVIQVRVNGSGWQLCSSGIPSSYFRMNTGDNTVDLLVTSEDESTSRTYNLTVRRLRGISGLSGLTVDSGTLTPVFAVDILEYSDTLLNTRETISITPVTEDSLASIMMSYNGGAQQSLASGTATAALVLEPGTNTIELVVTAEDPEVSTTYSLRAVRRYTGALDVGYPGGDQGIMIFAMAMQDDDKIIAGGRTYYYSTGNGRLVRLDSDGAADSTYANIEDGEWDNSSIRDLYILSDGSILAGGSFSGFPESINGTLVKLDGSGNPDTGFTTSEEIWGCVWAIDEQADGKIIVGGSFTTDWGHTRNRIARLNSDGSLDTTFLDTETGADNTVYAAAIQPDGKILIGGAFTEVNGTATGMIAKLNTDGSLDTSFPASGTSASGKLGDDWDAAVKSIVLQPDGKILIGGNFTHYNSISRNGIARLNADGTLDDAFLGPGSGTNDTVEVIKLLNDGTMYIGGSFSNCNGFLRNRIARLNSDGSLDTSFPAGGTGFSGTVYGIEVQSDGRIIIGGSFDSYDDQGPGMLVRIWPD